MHWRVWYESFKIRSCMWVKYTGEWWSMLIHQFGQSRHVIGRVGDYDSSFGMVVHDTPQRHHQQMHRFFRPPVDCMKEGKLSVRGHTCYNKSYIVRTHNICRSWGGGSSIKCMHCYDRHGKNNREGETECKSNEKVEILHLLDSNHWVQISCGIDKGDG